MEIGPDSQSYRTVNHVFGVLVALAFVWGLYSFNSPSVKVPDVPHIEVSQVAAQRAAGNGPLMLDVRGPESYAGEHIDGAMHIPLNDLPARARDLPADKTAQVVVYCGNGSNLGPLGTAKLQAMGYSNVTNLSGGIEGWRAAGQKVAAGKG